MGVKAAGVGGSALHDPSTRHFDRRLPALPGTFRCRVTGKRRLPASHPVFRAKLARVEELGIVSPWVTDRIEDMALLLARLPDDSLTVQQRKLMRLIAAELLRRADS
jgi:hypothetical protein